VVLLTCTSSILELTEKARTMNERGAVSDDVADLSIIIDLFKKLRREDLNRYGEEPNPLLEFNIDMLGRFLRDARLGTLVFLTLQHDLGTGIAICQISLASWSLSKTLNIHDLFVGISFRRMGLAGQLFDCIESTTLALGYSAVSLETTFTNAGAIKLYQKHGYLPLAKSLRTKMNWPDAQLADMYSDLTISFKKTPTRKNPIRKKQ